MTKSPQYVSGDWYLTKDSRYAKAYEVAALGKPWNGFAVPVLTKAVAEALVADQAAYNATLPEGTEISVLRWEGEDLVFDDTSHAMPGEEIDDSYLHTERPDENGNYRFDTGWCWDLVEADEVDVLVHADGTQEVRP